MTVDEASHVLMRECLNFEIRRVPDGYQFIRFVQTNIRVPRQFKLGDISEPITVNVPQLLPVPGPCARTFTELVEKILKEKD